MTTESTVIPIMIETDVDPHGVGIKVTHGDVELEHEISANDLEHDGWILRTDAPSHCNHDKVQPLDFGADSYRVMEDWHNDNHPGVFRVCAAVPCRDLIKATEVYE